MKRRLLQLDIYRRIPKDLTEATALGGIVTIVAIIILLILAISEIRNFLKVDIITSVLVDHSEDATFQMNFNVTIKGLSCEFAAIDLKNIIGRDREDIDDKTVHKFTLDGTWQGYATKNEQEFNYDTGKTNKDHYGNAKHAIELTPDKFQQALDDFEVLLVNFHAPWCPHCRDFAPIYEHAAEMVKEKAPHTIDAHHKHSAALGTVDCTERNNIELCRKNHVQAFPTVRVFRQSKNRENNAVMNNFMHYESYLGDRDADAVSDFTLKVLKEVIAGDEQLRLGEGTDSTGDGKADSAVHSVKGCRIEGYVMLQRVPGQLIIRAHSRGHSFAANDIIMDHTINHLSFGQHAPRMRLFEKLNQNLLKESEGIPSIGEEGAYAGDPSARPLVLSQGITEIGFEADAPGYSHEHYLKVVSRTHIPLKDEPLHSYEYTINSNTFKIKQVSGAVEPEPPKIVFIYDVSPLLVQTKESSKPWIEGLTSLSAIIGGIYACTMLIEALLQRLIGGLIKKLD